MYYCLSVNPPSVSKDLRPVSKDVQPVSKDLRPVPQDFRPEPQDLQPMPEDLQPMPEDFRTMSEDTKSSGGSWGIREILNTDTSTIVFASAFLVSLVVMAVVVRHLVRKRKAEDRQSLLVSDWEK